jgi:Flp pilus assembly secretin CpaC
MVAIMIGDPCIVQTVLRDFNINFIVADEAGDTIKEYASKSDDANIIQIVQYV